MTIGKGSEGSKPVSLSEALELLEERKKQGELGYEQQLAYDHAKKFVKLSAANAAKMIKELEELGISTKGAVKVTDTMPLDLNQLKQVLVIEHKALDEDLVKKVFAVVESYRGK